MITRKLEWKPESPEIRELMVAPTYEHSVNPQLVLRTVQQAYEVYFKLMAISITELPLELQTKFLNGLTEVVEFTAKREKTDEGVRKHVCRAHSKMVNALNSAVESRREARRQSSS